ncbi:NAD(P)H-binding protein [Nonomuraea sp. NPDC005983]|uniref:NAD(P)H-binding protein n=1 Tax=Nonomuraea sp. NPDC005983 TaxID=3155595 RepID=UPI0033A1B5FC
MNFTSTAPILVLGGRGKTGRRVVARLTDLGLPVRAASRSASAHHSSLARFDWDDPGTWASTLDGAGAVYIVFPNEHPDIATVQAFAAAAADGGVRRLVLLSARDADYAGEPFAERAVRESGLEWTILRPSWFAQNFSEGLFAGAVQAGELALPTGEGREAFVDAEDIADVAVAALAQDGHAGQVYELSGPRPLSFGTAVSMIAESSGRSIRYRHVEPAAYAAELATWGVPADLADILARLLEAIGHGSGDYVSDGVQRALGREPRAFEEYVKAAWT